MISQLNWLHQSQYDLAYIVCQKFIKRDYVDDMAITDHDS